MKRAGLVFLGHCIRSSCIVSETEWFIGRNYAFFRRLYPPNLIWSPRKVVSLLSRVWKLIPKNWSFWATGDKNCLIAQSLVLRQYQRVTDSRTDRRTETPRFSIAERDVRIGIRHSDQYVECIIALIGLEAGESQCVSCVWIASPTCVAVAVKVGSLWDA